MPPAFYYLVLPSFIVLILLVLHSIANRGNRATAIFFISAIVYGLIRALWIDHLTRVEFGTLFPYLMNFPVIKIGPVSFQEVVGWSVAATIAWLISDRLFLRFRITPAPHRIALLSFFILASLCLAVESAAIESGWWIWTIKQPIEGIFGRVPPVGILDWGFVAFDFLLPYLLFTQPASWPKRLIGLSLFPLHFYSHSKMIPFEEPVPLAVNDLSHAAIFAYVLICAVGERGKSILPEPFKERMRWLPLTSIAIVCSSTMLACFFESKNPAAAVYSIPLLVFGLVAYLKPAQALQEKKRKKDEENWGIFLSRIGIGILIFCVVYWLRVPFHRNTQIFSEAVQAGVERLNAGDFPGAETALRKAIQARPDQAGGRAILAHILMQNGNDAEARQQLETALRHNQTHQTALMLLTTLDLKEHRWSEAQIRAEKGHNLYPRRPEFVYQSVVASRRLKNENPAVVSEAVEVARQGGPSMLQSLAQLAMSLNDPLTAKACEQ